MAGGIAGALPRAGAVNVFKKPGAVHVQYGRGEFAGNILYVDPRGAFFFAKPKDQSLSRRFFYLDRRTVYSTVQAGKQKRKRFADVLEGARIHIRFIYRNDLALAEEVSLLAE